MKISGLPLYIIAGFNFFTLAMYIVSPYVFYRDGFLLSALFVFINIAALAFGYSRGERSGRRVVSNYTPPRGPLPNKLFSYLSVFYGFTFLVKYAYLLKFQILDIEGMVQHLLIGVANPKLGYQLSVDETRQATVSWSLYFVTSILNGVYFIVGFLLWSKLSRILKSIFVVFLLVEIFYWVGRGTNFGIISLVVTFLLANVVESKGKINVSLLVKYVSLFAVSLISFSTIMYSRSEGAVEDFQVFSLPWSYVDESSFLFDIVPPGLHTSMLTVFFYLVQGYYNTSIAFDLDFIPSWFGGWNPSIQSLYFTFGVDVADNTYIQRLDAYEVDPRVNWHSSYTWFANDVSFYGVPFVMFFMGYLIGHSWVKAVVSSGDIASKLLFVLLSGSALFLFANNNFIGYHFYSFLFLFPYWLYKNKFVS
jgi:hypothetical protein